jgi:diguanylate cyclase (GGDEF)-like protein
LENSARVRRARLFAAVAVGASAIYAVPMYGWWLLILFVLSVLTIEALEARMRRSGKPEYHAACNILLSQAVIAGAAALTGGPTSPLLSLIVVPTVLVAARFRAQVTLVATVIPIAMLLIATLGLHFHQTIAHDAGLVVAIDVVIGVSAAAQALYGAELQQRSNATLDPLTGLLNRQGLERRFNEIADQARLMDAPVSILICDLDHFKAVNDAHGHAVGDAVLTDVAYELRKQLRSFELIYRIGGEEFLVILPGATMPTACALANKLCEATRNCRSQGISPTLSIGVSTLCGADVQFRQMFDLADQALYRAKRNGRDRVACAEQQKRAGAPARNELTATAAPAV